VQDAVGFFEWDGVEPAYELELLGWGEGEFFGVDGAGEFGVESLQAVADGREECEVD